MSLERGGSRLRSFLLGGIVGGLAGLAASRLSEQRRRSRGRLSGLAAFEQAPCYEEAVERERESGSRARDE